MKLPEVSISRWLTNLNGDIYRSDGYVGIGTSSPTESLDINGSIKISGNIINEDLTETFQTIRQSCDGYQTQIDNIGTQINSSLIPLMNAADGYQNQINNISSVLDGYTTSTGSTGDGYVTFFTGTNKIAGDNDLFWDRANNRLGIHTASPSAELHVVGTITSPGAGTTSEHFGLSSVASGTNSVSIGNASTASGTKSTAIGQGATASGGSFGGTAIGQASSATGAYGLAIGITANASSTWASAIGYGATASNQYAQSYGYQAAASNEYTVAVGHQSTASASGSVAIGKNATASGIVAVSIGQISQATQTNAVAIGQNARALGSPSVALGANAVANGAGCISFGEDASTSDSSSMSFGSASSAALGGIAFGGSSAASATSSIAFGTSSSVAVNCNYTVAVGPNISVTNAAADCVVIGHSASSTGSANTVVGTSAVGGASGGGTSIGQLASADIGGTALGHDAIANSYESISIGGHATSNGFASTLAIGHMAEATAQYDGVIGRALEPINLRNYGNITSGKNTIAGQQFGQSQIKTNTPVIAAQVIEWNNCNHQILNLSDAPGDVTLTFASSLAGSLYTLEIEQSDAPPFRNVIWPANVQWIRGITPIITTIASRRDIVSLAYDGYNFTSDIIQNDLMVGGTIINANLSQTLDGYASLDESNVFTQSNTFAGSISVGGNIINEDLTQAFSDIRESCDAYGAIFTDTELPTGVLTVPTPSAAYVNPNVVATVTGNHIIYIDGTKISKTTASVSIAEAEGRHYVYYNASGVLTISTTIWDILDTVQLFSFYWDATAHSVVGDISYEFHSITMSKGTHDYLHSTRGTAYESGLPITYTANDSTVTTIGIGNGIIHDEDIEFSITHADSPSSDFQQILYPVAQIPVYYLTGASSLPRKFVATIHPYVTAGTGRIAYNQFTGGAWQQTEVGNVNYVAYWIIATSNIREPIISIQGQRTDISLANARANNDFAQVNQAILQFNEFKLLYRVIFQATNTNDKAQIVDVTDSRLSISGGNAVASALSHSSLSGLLNDDHPQYALINGTRDFTGDVTINGNIINTALKTALDGYTASTGSTGDGYVTFFTGTNKIAGDNDLFWDRANNRLGIHTTSPSAELHVVGTITSPGTGATSEHFGLLSSASTTDSTAVGYNAQATTGTNATAFGSSSTATAAGTTALGKSANASAASATAVGLSSVAGGIQGSAFGNAASAGGQASTALGKSANASNSDSVAIGSSAASAGQGGVAIGYSATASALVAVAIGQNSQATQTNAVALGQNARALISTGVALGANATAQSNTGAIAIGDASISSGSRSVAIGTSSSATGTAALAFGSGATANVNTSLAIGDTAIVSATESVVIGNNATCNQINSVAIGRSASVTVSSNAVAIGYQAATSQIATVAIGSTAIASGAGGTAIGYGTDATGTASVAIGRDAQATQNDCTAIGYNVQATTNINNTAIGSGASATVIGGTAVGKGATAGNATGATAFGAGASANCITTGGTAIGYNAGVSGVGGIAIGNSTTATGNSAISIGISALSQSTYCVAIGRSANAAVQYGTAVGPSTNIQAYNSVAIGNSATILHSACSYSVAIGNGATCKTLADNSVAIGADSKCEATTSIAIGSNAVTSGASSIAIGYLATTSAYTNALAIGNGATATGNNTGSIGSYTNPVSLTVYGDLSATSSLSVGADGYFTANVIVSGQIAPDLASDGYLVPTGDANINWNAGNAQIVSLQDVSSPCVLTLTNPINGGSYNIMFIQGSSAKTITFPNTFRWSGGTIGSLTATAYAVDILSLFYYDGSYYVNLVGDLK
ncbi:MAG: hypothetical protein WC523_00635 [Patescibacteria group bacterium]